jgi:hypothetical protein
MVPACARPPVTAGRASETRALRSARSLRVPFFAYPLNQAEVQRRLKDADQRVLIFRAPYTASNSNAYHTLVVPRHHRTKPRSISTFPRHAQPLQRHAWTRKRWRPILYVCLCLRRYHRKMPLSAEALLMTTFRTPLPAQSSSTSSAFFSLRSSRSSCTAAVSSLQSTVRLYCIGQMVSADARNGSFCPLQACSRSLPVHACIDCRFAGYSHALFD